MCRRFVNIPSTARHLFRAPSGKDRAHMRGGTVKREGKGSSTFMALSENLERNHLNFNIPLNSGDLALVYLIIYLGLDR